MQPLSGNNAQYGEVALNCVKLGVKMINAQGGFNGKEVRIVSYDDQASPEESVKIVTKMIEVDKVNAVISSIISSCVLASSQPLNEAKVITFGTGNSPTWMKQGWKYVFRALLNTDFVMPVLADTIKNLGMSKVAVFEGQDDSGKAGGTSFRAACKDAGLTVTTTENYIEGDSDFSGQVARIINSGAECVFSSTLGSTQAQIAKQLRQFGFEGLVFNKDQFQPESISVAGSAADYFAFAYPYIPYSSLDECEDPVMVDFLKMYQAEYGKLPTTDCAYRAWDSLMVLWEAVKNAKSNDSENIRIEISKISNYRGLGGIFDFSAGDGEGLKAIKKFIVVNNKYSDFDSWLGKGGFDDLQKRQL
jgi:branched-chain amino acid transport system substrate-binding protein